MTVLRHAVSLSTLLCVVDCFRARVNEDETLGENSIEALGVVEGDCSWARLDTSTGWQCETIKTFSGGFQGNTKLVRLSKQGEGAFNAVLKEMNSNQNVAGLASLENEKKVAKVLQEEKHFTQMPKYFFDLKVQKKYQKYKFIDDMSVAEKENCDHSRTTDGKCELNPEWNKCNGNMGNLDTTKQLLGSEMRKKGLTCPDTQLLAMEFLVGYQDLKGMQPVLKQESDFRREVRAAALFLAYDKMMTAGVSHCDFNPGNAMFSEKDPRNVKIIDFGLARTNDHPVGRCTGKLEDIGRPGALWLSLYRGHRNAEEFGDNDKKPGPYYLGARQEYRTPSDALILPFSLMRGSFKGKGRGHEAWNKETRQNWPAIVAYAQVLMNEADKQANDDPTTYEAGGNAAPVFQPKPEVPQTPPRQPVVKPNVRPEINRGPTREDAVKNVGPKPVEVQGNAGLPACKRFRTNGRGQCEIKLEDSSACLVKISCPYTRQVFTKELAPGSGFMDSIKIPNCANCQVSQPK